MKISTLFLLMVLGATAAFAAFNWSTFMAPTTLYLGVAEVQAPLGLIMLGLVAFLTLFFLVYVVYLQTAVLFDARRNAKELHANRELAEQAEASRFTELRVFFDMEMEKQAKLSEESKAAVLARIETLDRDFRAAIEQSENTLSAYIGELEDRLERDGHGQGSQSTA